MAAHHPNVTAEEPSAFINFMRSFPGRALRIVAGMIILYLGFFVIEGVEGTIVGLIGLVPIAAGVFNFCLAGPLFHVDLHGHPRRYAR